MNGIFRRDLFWGDPSWRNHFWSDLCWSGLFWSDLVEWDLLVDDLNERDRVPRDGFASRGIVKMPVVLTSASVSSGNALSASPACSIADGAKSGAGPTRG